MGNVQFSRPGEHLRQIANEELSELIFREVITTYKMFHVYHVWHSKLQTSCLAKFYYFENMDKKMLSKIEMLMQEKNQALIRGQLVCPNLLPYSDIRLTPNLAVILRPFFKSLPSLYDRLHSQPFFDPSFHKGSEGATTCVEKKFLIFQLLLGVAQLYARTGMLHGDLKSENLFVTPALHLLMTDFAWMKPETIPLTDPEEYTFFFEGNQERDRCFLAPERFYAKPREHTWGSPIDSLDMIKTEIFSLGLLIAEILLDGLAVLQLPDILALRGDENLTNLRYLQKIPDLQMLELVSQMTKVQINERPQLSTLIQSDIFPSNFFSLYAPLIYILQHPVFQKADDKVCFLRRRFPDVLENTFGGSQAFEGWFDQVFRRKESSLLNSYHSPALVTGSSSIFPPDQQPPNGLIAEFVQRECPDLDDFFLRHAKCASVNACDPSLSSGSLKYPRLTRAHGLKFFESLYQGFNRDISLQIEGKPPGDCASLFGVLWSDLDPEPPREPRDFSGFFPEEANLSMLVIQISSYLNHCEHPPVLIAGFGLLKVSSYLCSSYLILEYCLPVLCHYATLQPGKARIPETSIQQVGGQALRTITSLLIRLHEEHPEVLPPDEAKLVDDYVTTSISFVLKSPAQMMTLEALAACMGLLLHSWKSLVGEHVLPQAEEFVVELITLLQVNDPRISCIRASFLGNMSLLAKIFQKDTVVYRFLPHWISWLNNREDLMTKHMFYAQVTEMSLVVGDLNNLLWPGWQETVDDSFSDPKDHPENPESPGLTRLDSPVRPKHKHFRGRLVDTYYEHREENGGAFLSVNCLDTASNGRILISGCRDSGRCKIWDTSPESLCTFSAADPRSLWDISSLSNSPLLAATSAKAVNIFQIDRADHAGCPLIHQWLINQPLVVDSHENLVVCGCSSAKLSGMDIRTHKKAFHFQISSDPQESRFVVPNKLIMADPLCVTTTYQGTVSVHDLRFVALGQPLREWKVSAFRPPSQVRSMVPLISTAAFSGGIIYLGLGEGMTCRGTILGVDLVTAEVSSLLTVDQNRTDLKAPFLHDISSVREGSADIDDENREVPLQVQSLLCWGSDILGGGTDGIVRRWNPEPVILTKEHPASKKTCLHDDSVLAMAILGEDDGNPIMATSARDGLVKLWR